MVFFFQGPRGADCTGEAFAGMFLLWLALIQIRRYHQDACSSHGTSAAGVADPG